ncbi:MAG: aminotransferase class V-fold PLP-dependent enzyme [Candidatus Peribacteraceae bacterium]|nr:aminotransferase class V-fold PLP-dependent enzyme [Candidatus Peribacteraceae bacterium]
MTSVFFEKKNRIGATVSASDFGYLQAGSCYLDAACQTLRPQPVLDAETEYYTQYNACGGRVKYDWGTTVDNKVRAARKALLTYAGKNEKDYCVAFTLNTTYGINLVLHQLAAGSFERIVTSDIEHNSVLLPSMTWAQRNKAKHTVLPRAEDGSLVYTPADIARSVVVVNTMSNIDGRTLQNAAALARDVHGANGLLILDGAQGFGHAPQLLRQTDFDVACGSGHKMYGPSIGFIIIRRSLLAGLTPFFIGGGTVSDVTLDGFSLLSEGDEAHAILEAGLQNWSGILGLAAAINWLEHADHTQEQQLAQMLFDGLQKEPRIHLLNTQPSSIISFHIDGIDAHQMALYLSQQHIMCRSGHFCCHRYLAHQQKLPPLLRLSLGLYNTPQQIEQCLSAIHTILTTL